jgi:hypothetical protein
LASSGRQKEQAQNEEDSMTSENKHSHSGVGPPLAGAIWFIGWLFTIAYADLVWWKIILGIVVWPYYLGLAVG